MSKTVAWRQCESSLLLEEQVGFSEVLVHQTIASMPQPALNWSVRVSLHVSLHAHARPHTNTQKRFRAHPHPHMEPHMQSDERHARLHQQLLSAVQGLHKKATSKIRTFEAQLSDVSKVQAVQKNADLITANLYRIPSGWPKKKLAFFLHCALSSRAQPATSF